MSTEVTNLAWFVESIPNTTKMVLLRLADHANERYECWPSQIHLARRCGMSTRSVVRHIQKLQDCGFIKKISRFSENNKYVINIDAIEAEALPVIELEREERKAAQKRKCQNVTCDDDHKCQDGVTPYVTPTVTLITNESPDLNNPIVPSKGQGGKTRLTNTSNPHHKDYKLTSEDKNQILDTWSSISKDKYKGARVITTTLERAITKLYSAYKRYHKDGVHTGKLKTKVEFTKSYLNGFDQWVERQPQPLAYQRAAIGKPNTWVACLVYALKITTYEKIING